MTKPPAPAICSSKDTATSATLLALRLRNPALRGFPRWIRLPRSLPRPPPARPRGVRVDEKRVESRRFCADGVQAAPVPPILLGGFPAAAPNSHRRKAAAKVQPPRPRRFVW